MTGAHSIVTPSTEMPKETFELSLATVGCDQQCPSEGACQSQQTLGFAVPGGSCKHVSWADPLTPQGPILQLAGNAKTSEGRISLSSEGNFSQVPCLL